MSLDLLMGYAGMVSFGHSAFFGVGGYVAALALVKSPGARLGARCCRRWPAALAALVIGFFSIRVSGVYFIMLTLAFSQMFYAYAFQAAWLGAEDGIVGVPRPPLLGVASARPLRLPRLPAWRSSALAALVLWRVVRSPFGHVLRGIHENEARMEAVGYAGQPLQAPGLRHRGDPRGPGGLALRPVQRLDHAGRLLLDDVGRGAADGHHRRHRHPRRRGARAPPPSSCSRAWSAPTPSAGC